MDFKLFLTFLMMMVAIAFAYEKEHIVSPLLNTFLNEESLLISS